MPLMVCCYAGESAGIRAVSFVRCFQMTHEGLDAALAAAASQCSKLSMAAFSHLDLAEWRKQQAYIMPESSPSDSSDDYALSLRVISQSFMQAPRAGSLQVTASRQNAALCRAPALQRLCGCISQCT